MKLVKGITLIFSFSLITVQLFSMNLVVNRDTAVYWTTTVGIATAGTISLYGSYRSLCQQRVCQKLLCQKNSKAVVFGCVTLGCYLHTFQQFVNCFEIPYARLAVDASVGVAGGASIWVLWNELSDPGFRSWRRVALAGCVAVGCNLYNFQRIKQLYF